MKNKILILHETSPASQRLGIRIFTPLSEQWDLEPELFGVDFSKLEHGPRLFTWNLVTNWAPAFANIKRSLQFRLLAPEESLILNKLRQFQPPIVVVTSARAALVMCSIKSKGLYLGRLVLVFPEFSYQEFTECGADSFVCMNKLQGDSLKALNILEDKIMDIATLSKPSTLEQSDENMRGLGLLSTMPVVFVHSAGTDEGIESYRRLLRSATSFQIALLVPPDAIEKFKNISAPAAHPIKFITNPDRLEDYIKFASAIIVDDFSYDVVECAALNKRPLIVINNSRTAEYFSRLVMEGLVAVARVPAETQYLAEGSIQKKKTSDTDKMFAYLANSQAKMQLHEGLAQIMPEPGPRISNYQEKSK